MIDKGVCDKGFIWDPSNCECEYDKSCDIGEYLDYENCKCRKKVVDKLVEECTENVEEVKLTKINSAEDENMHKNKCSSCILAYLHCVDFSNLYNKRWDWYLFCLLHIHKSL